MANTISRNSVTNRNRSRSTLSSHANRTVVSKSNRMVITPKTTQINFNMIGSVATLHIHTKNGSLMGTLVCNNGRLEFQPKTTTSQRLMEVCIIEQAYNKLRELVIKELEKSTPNPTPNSTTTRRPRVDKSKNNDLSSIQLGDKCKLNVKGADSLKSVDPNWITDIRIVQIINNSDITLL